MEQCSFSYQLVLPFNLESLVPDDDPVRLLAGRTPFVSFLNQENIHKTKRYSPDFS
jgi:hypothetical protein